MHDFRKGTIMRDLRHGAVCLPVAYWEQNPSSYRREPVGSASSDLPNSVQSCARRTDGKWV